MCEHTCKSSDRPQCFTQVVNVSLLYTFCSSLFLHVLERNINMLEHAFTSMCVHTSMCECLRGTVCGCDGVCVDCGLCVVSLNFPGRTMTCE